MTGAGVLVLEQSLNGLQFGLMLFLLAAGLTLVFGVMDMINLAHGSLYMVGAFLGAWILFKTQLGNTDILVRTITDALWMASPKARAASSVRTIYYGILVIFSIWGAVAIRSASPFTLFKILANMAGVVLMISGVQIFLVNRRFLPAEVRPPLWREAGLLLCSAFYAFFTFFVARDLLRSLF